MAIQALAVTDTIDQRIYSASLKVRMEDVGIAFSCGDLPARYLEFIVDALDKPLYYVLGNHAEEMQREDGGKPRKPLGCIDLSGKVIRDPSTGLILAGLPGSPRYNSNEPEQYSELGMLWKIAKMTPKLWWNRRKYGRAVDMLITHAPPRDLNDRDDPAHRGFTAIRRFLHWFAPAYHLHGHVHLYDRSQSPVLTFDATTIINVYPYQVLDLAVPALTPELVQDHSGRAGEPTGTRLPVGVGGRPLAASGGGRTAEACTETHRPGEFAAERIHDPQRDTTAPGRSHGPVRQDAFGGARPAGR